MLVTKVTEADARRLHPSLSAAPRPQRLRVRVRRPGDDT
jgi:hypothetical protein